MQARRRHLAGRPQAFHARAPVHVGCDAAHVIMRRRRDRDQLRHRVDPGRLAVGEHGRIRRRKAITDRLAAIEERAASGDDFFKHPARHDIARRQFRIGMMPQHEPLAGLVDEQRTFATQGLGRKRSGIGTDIDRRRMELHELRIGDHRSRPRGKRDRLPARIRRVRRHRIKPADAARCQHHRARRNELICALAARLAARQTNAHHAAILDHEIFRLVPRQHADRRRRPRRRDQRLHDGGTRPVSGHAHDALRRMRGLPRQHEMAFQIAVERHAVAKKIAHAIPRFFRNRPRHVLIDDARTCNDRVVRMRLSRVALADSGRDPALRPHARRAFAERRGSHDRHRQRRELQRREEASQSGADDDDVTRSERASPAWQSR